ncbi:MAG: prolyl oligopeptidase family serine peptidase, partial [Planctomycetaceae bacterium]
GPVVAADEADPDVRIVKDVAYLGEDRAEKMDLYFPAKIAEGAKLPAVLIIHGGGWYAGDKGAAREINIGTTLAKSGYVCASINYVLGEEHGERFIRTLTTVWPKNLHDCKTAVRYLRKNADEYHIDVEHIGVIGGSAGGHLTSMVGMTGPDDGLDPDGLYNDHSCRVQAIVPLYGVYDFTAMTKFQKMYDDSTDAEKALCLKTSPVAFATKDDPPALLIHGTGDATVPVEESELLHQALEAAGVPSELVIVEGAPHSFHLQPKERDLRAQVIGFFDKHLKP